MVSALDRRQTVTSSVQCVGHLCGERSRNRGALDGRERSHSVALGAIGDPAELVRNATM